MLRMNALIDRNIIAIAQSFYLCKKVLLKTERLKLYCLSHVTDTNMQCQEL